MDTNDNSRILVFSGADVAERLKSKAERKNKRREERERAKKEDNNYLLITDPDINILEGLNVPDKYLEDFNDKLLEKFGDRKINADTISEMREYIKGLISIHVYLYEAGRHIYE